MSTENEMLFFVRMKDEATAVIKDLGKNIEALGKSAKGASEDVNKAAEANTRYGASMKSLLGDTKAAQLATEALGNAHRTATSFLEEHAKGAGGLGERLMSLGPAGLIAAAGIGAFIEKTREGLAAYIDFEKQSIKLDASLKATGQSGKATMAGLQEEAAKISKGTIFDEDATTRAMAALVKNGMISAEKLKKIMPGVLDFAAMSGRTPEEAAKMVGLIYSNPERAIPQMAREMKNLSSVERRRLVGLTESGQFSEASDALFAKLADKNKGAAEALTAGIGGAYGLVKKELSEWTEESNRSFGKMIADTVGLEGKLRFVAEAIAAARNAGKRSDSAAPRNEAESQAQDTQAQIDALRMNPQSFGMMGGRNGVPGRNANEAIALLEKRLAAAKDEAGMSSLDNTRALGGFSGIENEEGRIERTKAEYKKQLDAADELVVRLDPVESKQKKLNKEIDLMGLAIVAATALGTPGLDKLRETLSKLQNEAAQVNTAFDKLVQGQATLFRDAGQTPAEKAFSTVYDKYSKAAADKLGVDPALLSNSDSIRNNPLLVAKNPDFVGSDSQTNALKAAQEQANAELEGVFTRNFERERMQREREIALIIEAMQPGRRGQDASDRLAALKEADAVAGGANSKNGQLTYDNKLTEERQKRDAQQRASDQQEATKYRDQAEVIRLQAALTAGKGATVTSSGGGQSLIDAVHYNESRNRMSAGIYGDKNADGVYEAAGPMQVHQGALDVVNQALGTNYTHAQLAAQPEIGMQVGSKYLQMQRDTFGRDDYAMGAYNAGPGAMRQAIASGKGLAGLPDSTQEYVRNGMARMGESSSTSIAAGPVGLGDIKNTAELMTKALAERDAKGISLGEALAKLAPELKEISDSQKLLTLATEQRSLTNQKLLNDAETKGGPEGRREAERKQQVFDQYGTGVVADEALKTKRAAAAVANDTKQIATNISLRESIELTQKETELAGALPEVRQHEIDLLKLRQEAIREGWDKESATYKDRLALIDQQTVAQEQLRRAQGPLQSYIQQGAEDWKTWETAAVGGIQAAESTMSGLLTGTLSVRDGVAKLAKSFADLAANAAVKSIFNSVVGGVSGLFTGGVGGAIGGAAGGGSVFDGAGATSSGVKLANGGVMGSGGSIPLHMYASGGVASSPQMAIFGEGAHNEAYVPLPDGRSIPVSMKGGGGSNMQNNFNVTVNTGGGSGGGASGGGGSGGPGAADIGSAVAAQLRNMVVEVIQSEQRSGGALNSHYES